MRKFTTIAAVVAAIGVVSSASAQVVNRPIDVTPTNISVRGGVVLPLDSNLRDLGTTLVGLGVDYRLPRSLLSETGETYVSLDYFSTGLPGRKGTVVPICLNQRFYTGTNTFGRRTYGFIGLGVSVIDATDSNTVISARAGFGAELGDALFFETTGYISDRAGDTRGNAVAFYIGYRF